MPGCHVATLLMCLLTLSISVPWHFLNLLFSEVRRSAADCSRVMYSSSSSGLSHVIVTWPYSNTCTLWMYIAKLNFKLISDPQQLKSIDIICVHTRVSQNADAHTSISPSPWESIVDLLKLVKSLVSICYTATSVLLLAPALGFLMMFSKAKAASSIIACWLGIIWRSIVL